MTFPILAPKLVNAHTVKKPWGEEKWIELNDRYCYKQIIIVPGHKTSFQYHEKKSETNLLMFGSAVCMLENDEGVVEAVKMDQGSYVTVPTGRKHRIIAETYCVFLEVSTPEVDDVIRVEDDFDRPDGRIESEHQ